MVRIYILMVAIVLSITPIMADKKSEKILDEMSSAIDAMGGYEVSFDVESGGHSVAEGVYVVDHDLYKLELGHQEIYGDGEFRFTIDNALREVVMERVATTIPMVVANPARAFSSLNKSFESKIVEGNNISILLTPRKENDLIDSTLIEVDPTTKLPKSARYIAGGEVVEVTILSIEDTQERLTPLNDMILPEGYDIIDIR